MSTTSLVGSPVAWHGSCVGTESTLHQIAPYIGKMKSTMARALILAASSPGDTIFEPFVGSGVIALESLIYNRNIVCCDSNPYAIVLTKAKLFPPSNLATAIDLAEEYIHLSTEEIVTIDLNTVPKWVQTFFHPATLKEVMALVQVLKRNDQNFLLACLLGILHHQRPGFLSYPASHAIPYLRTKKFPRDKYPELYDYRSLKPRLLRKIERVYKRFPQINQSLQRICFFNDVSRLNLPKNSIDAVITSPPYMNALDYVRDNRLRLWFLGYDDKTAINEGKPLNLTRFENLMYRCFQVINYGLRPGGKCFFVIGEVRTGKRLVDTTEIIRNTATEVGNFKCVQLVEDYVPQDRRIRKSARRVKREYIVVLEKEE